MRLSPTTAPVLKGTAWASLSGAMLCVTLATGSGIAVAEHKTEAEMKKAAPDGTDYTKVQSDPKIYDK